MTLIYGVEKIQIPSDIKKFLFDYQHSKFIECNRKYAKESVKHMGDKYSANELQIIKARDGFVYVKSVLEGMRKNYWLAAGSLLGWYRDCSFIPHTTDGKFILN